MYNCQYPQCINWYQNPYMNPQMGNMPQMNNPVSNMPVQNMPQNYTAAMPAGMYSQQPVMPANMYAQPQMMGMDDQRLEMMYPTVYFKAMPMIKHHCDMMEAKHGMMHYPTKEEMDKIKDDIYEKLDKEMDDEEEDEHDHHHDHHHEDDCGCKRDDDIILDDTGVYGDRRRPRYGRGNAIRDLVSILLINELLRRRRGYYNPYHGWGY